MDFKADWSFLGLSSDRIKALSNCPPYNEIIRRIDEQVKPAEIKFVIDEGWAQPVTGALRPPFLRQGWGRVGGLIFQWSLWLSSSVLPECSKWRCCQPLRDPTDRSKIAGSRSNCRLAHARSQPAAERRIAHGGSADIRIASLHIGENLG